MVIPNVWSGCESMRSTQALPALPTGKSRQTFSVTHYRNPNDPDSGPRPEGSLRQQASSQKEESLRQQSSSQNSGPRPLGLTRYLPNSSIQGLRGLTTEDIESFKKLGAEVCLTTDFGDVWLVPEYTNQTRKEFIPEHMALICHALYAFPGARMVSFEDLPNTETEERQ